MCVPGYYLELVGPVLEVAGECPQTMSTDRAPSPKGIERQLSDVGTFVQIINAGLGVILSAFLLAVIGLLWSPTGRLPAVLEAILQPLIFVGLGLLLFGIGRHLHLLHLNLVRQLQMNPRDQHDSDTGDSE